MIIKYKEDNAEIDANTIMVINWAVKKINNINENNVKFTTTSMNIKITKNVCFVVKDINARDKNIMKNNEYHINHDDGLIIPAKVTKAIEKDDINKKRNV